MVFGVRVAVRDFLRSDSLRSLLGLVKEQRQASACTHYLAINMEILCSFSQMLHFGYENPFLLLHSLKRVYESLLSCWQVYTSGHTLEEQAGSWSSTGNFFGL